MEKVNLTKVTDKNFQNEVLKVSLPVLVDFWAEWCPPCRMIAPIVEELAKEWVGKIKVAKLNVDDHQRIASQYGIRSIPTLLLFKEGKVVERVVGFTSKKELKKRIENALSQAK